MPLEKKLKSALNKLDVSTPLFNAYVVLTFAVDGEADVIKAEMAPVAESEIVKLALLPCVTVTSFVTPVSSAVTSSASVNVICARDCDPVAIR